MSRAYQEEADTDFFHNFDFCLVFTATKNILNLNEA